MTRYEGKSDLAAKTCSDRLQKLAGLTEEFSIITDGLNYFQGFKLHRELYPAYTDEYCDFLDQLMSDTASWYEIIINGDHTGYYSHCLGYVARKTKKGLKIIEPFLAPSKMDNYPRVDLGRNHRSIDIHLAIAKHTPEHRAFLEFICEKEKAENPAYKMAMENPQDTKILFNHVNEKKDDCRLCNMQICNATWNSFYSKVVESGHEFFFEMIVELRRQWAEIVGNGGITSKQKNSFIAQAAESYGVDPKVVRRIINGDSYKWIK